MHLRLAYIYIYCFVLFCRFDAPKELKCTVCYSEDAIDKTACSLSWKNSAFDFVVMKKKKNAVSWDFISTPTYDSSYIFNDLVIDEEYMFSILTHSIFGKSAASEIAYTHLGKLYF